MTLRGSFRLGHTDRAVAGKILYVYAIARNAVTPRSEAVDGTSSFGTLSRGKLSAVFSEVDREEFDQGAIDRRSGDLEWLGAIGYRHQAVVSDLMKQTAIVPLRAFTLFSGKESLESYLNDNAASLDKVLSRLDGKQEWTLRVEFNPEKWSEALLVRADPLRAIAGEIESASAGKAFLLKKKLEEERKRASKNAEQQVVSEIEKRILETLRCDAVSESREQRGGAFPQINILINRDEEAVLTDLHRELTDRYGREGVTLAVTGPWPPYTFANA